MRSNPYIRILKAYEKGKGVVLSPEEVQFMRFDAPIETAAVNTMSGEVIHCAGMTMDKRGIIPETTHDEG